MTSVKRHIEYFHFRGKIQLNLLVHFHHLTDEEQEDGVGNEKGAAAVLVGEVGEAPHVADADREADAREDELPLGAPVVPLDLVLLVVILLQW